MNDIDCSKAENSSLSSRVAQGRLSFNGLPGCVSAILNLAENWPRTGRKMGAEKTFLLFLPPFFRQFFEFAVHIENCWLHLRPVAVNRFLARGGDLKHLALDYASDLFKLAVVREEEDAALSLPHLRDLSVADENRRSVRVVRAELQSVLPPVEEQDFLRQIESDARSPLVLAVEHNHVAWREPPLDGFR